MQYKSPFRWDHFNTSEVISKQFSEVLRNNLSSSKEKYMIIKITGEMLCFYCKVLVRMCHLVIFIGEEYIKYKVHFTLGNTKYILPLGHK